MKAAAYLSRALNRVLAGLGHGEQVGTVVRGAGAFLIIRVAGAGLAFLSQILLARWFGPFEYGVFTYAWVWVVVLAVAAPLGFEKATVRLIPEYVAGEKWALISGIIRSGPAVVFLGGLVLAAAGCLVVHFISARIAPHYVTPLYLAMASVPVFALLAFFSDLSRPFGWLRLAFIPMFIARNVILIIGAAIAAALFGAATANAILVVAFLSCLFSLTGQVIIFRRRLPPEIRDARPSRHMRSWLAVSVPLLLVGSFQLVTVNLDIVMLGAFVEPRGIAIYNGAVRTVGLLNFIPVAMAALSMPRFSALHAQGRQDELRRLVSGVIQWIFWPSLALAIMLALFGDLILSLFGPAFTAGHTVLIVLALGHMIVAAAGGVVGLLTMVGQHRICAVVIGSSAALNVLLNLALIPYFGLIGAATATVITFAVKTAWLVAVARRRLGIHVFVVPVKFPEAPAAGGTP